MPAPANEPTRRVTAVELCKAEWMADRAASAWEEGQSVVAFLCFRESIAHFANTFTELTRERVPTLHGGTALFAREKMLEDFQADRVRILAAQISAGGVGVSDAAPPASPLLAVLLDRELLRLNFGIFSLHAVQMAIFVVVPLALINHGGMAVSSHWKVYLPVVLGSFVLMGGVFPLERRGYLRAVFLSAIALIALVQVALLWVSSGAPSITCLAWLLFAFFCGFNVLEATQPSLVSRIAPASSRGAAMGVYNTLQSLGFFAGGVMGGQLVKSYGTQGLFLTCAALMVLWLVVAWPMVAPKRVVHPTKTP